MTDTQTQCDDNQLLAMLRTDDNLPSQQSIIGHVETCERCQVRLAELAAGNDQWQKVASTLSDHGGIDDGVDAELEQTVMPRLSHLCDRSDQWTESMVKQLLEPPSHPEMLGRLGRYEIERLIGSGGMGIVFKAHDTELNRPVAIKMLAPYLASSGSARKRFAREARSAAGIVDDHVVPIHNVESESDPPFLVMQYVAGGSLQEKLDRNGPLTVVEIVRIGLQAAKGLAAAHSHGLIHRDVKPSNILLDEGVERALLTDFGLARTEDDACLTRSGFQPGTPHYMSPEQVRGEAIDGRSDLFGLGCVMYALCTGRPPFRADSGYAVLRRITDDTPRSIREVNPDIPEWLEAIVMKLLEKDRDARFRSASEVVDTLGDWLAHAQQPSVVPLPASPAPTAAAKTKSEWGVGKYLMGAAASLLLLLAGVMIILETAKGTIRIESDVDGVPIRITQSDKVVESLTVTREGASVRVAAGDYVVDVGEGIDDIQVDGSRVSLARRGFEVVRTTRAQKNFHAEPMESESPLLTPPDGNASSSHAKFGGIRITDKMCRIIGQSTSAGRLAIYAGDANSDAMHHFVGVLAPAGFFEVEFRPVLPSNAIGVEMESIRMAVVTEEGEVRERVISTSQLAKRGVKSGKLKIRYAFGDEGPIRSAERMHFADLRFDDQSKLPVFLAFQSLGEVESDSRGETSFEERLQGKWQLVRQVTGDGDTQAIPRNAVCEIKGNQLYFEDSNAKKHATFSIDESKSPIHIDLKIDGDTKAGRGLVALESFRLTLCLTDLDSSDAPRPSELKPIRGYWYMEFVRPEAGATEGEKPRLPMPSIASSPRHATSSFSSDASGTDDGKSVEKLLDGAPLTEDGLAVLPSRLAGAEVELVHEIRTEDDTYTASYLIQYRGANYCLYMEKRRWKKLYEFTTSDEFADSERKLEPVHVAVEKRRPHHYQVAAIHAAAATGSDDEDLGFEYRRICEYFAVPMVTIEEGFGGDVKRLTLSAPEGYTLEQAIESLKEHMSTKSQHAEASNE